MYFQLLADAVAASAPCFAACFLPLANCTSTLADGVLRPSLTVQQQLLR